VRIERERSEWPPPCEGVALTHSCPPKKTTNETKVSPKVDFIHMKEQSFIYPSLSFSSLKNKTLLFYLFPIPMDDRNNNNKS
jgi:hypothetical protein